MSQTIDLSSLDTTAASESGAELELVHPVSGEPLGVFLTLAGADSSQWRRAIADIAERRGRKKTTSESARRDAIEIIARVTLSWRNVYLDGAELPFSRENAMELYTRFGWIREQADAFCSDRANFLPA